MAVREKRNAIKIEGWRLSRVPIDKTETIFQGDMLAWVDATKLATKLTGTSGAQFLGVSETSNPVETIGSPTFLSDTQNARVNVMQQGLVEMIAGESMTIFPFDKLTSGVDAQTVLKTGAVSGNMVGLVDPAVGNAGKAVVAGDVVKMWLQVPDLLRVWK